MCLIPIYAPLGGDRVKTGDNVTPSATISGITADKLTVTQLRRLLLRLFTYYIRAPGSVLKSQ